MKLDPIRDIAPPPLGSLWADRITGQLWTVYSYRQRQGRFVETVTLRSVDRHVERIEPHGTFRAEYVAADPPPATGG